MRTTYLLLTYLIVIVTTACTDNDSFTTDRSFRLDFSVDTVKLDTVFSTVGSSTYTLWAYNRTDDGIRIASVRLKNGNQTGFRVNVDGSYLDNTTGSVVTDLEIRRGDSIRVFVELTAPENHQAEPKMIEDQLIFTLESGVAQDVTLKGYAWDATTLTDLVISSDTTIQSARPIVIYGDGIRVDSGAVLNICNTTLYFHDNAGMTVNGSLRTDNVIMRGDRLDHMFDYLPYDRVSGQWRGITLGKSSTGNVLNDTEIRNAMTALQIDSAAIDSTTRRVVMTRCKIHNSKGYGLLAHHSNIALSYCQLSNALNDCLTLYGGIAYMNRCTIAQFYPFVGGRGAAFRFSNQGGLQLTCDSTIITGYEGDVVMAERPDTTLHFNYTFANCLLRTPAVENDTVNFRNIQWESPKDSIQGKMHFVKVDEENLDYDFHLDTLSTAKGKGCY